jgi:hypothetical protein
MVFAAFVPTVWRLEDIGADVLWGLLALVPLLNIALAFCLFCAPRDYARTKESDRVMKLLTIPFIVVGIPVAVVLNVAMLKGLLFIQPGS